MGLLKKITKKTKVEKQVEQEDVLAVNTELTHEIEDDEKEQNNFVEFDSSEEGVG